MYGMFNGSSGSPTTECPTSFTAKSMTSAYYIDKPEEAARYTKALDQMCAQAAPADADRRHPPQHPQGELT